MRTILIALLMTFATQAGAEKVLYCLEDLGTGFFLKDGRWQSSSFTTERFAARFENNYSKLELFGDSYQCAVPWGISRSQRVCTHEYDVGWTFIYGIETQKFIWVECSAASYTGSADTDTCSVYLGKCESF